ncbi:MAG: hypothetical protein ABSF98_17185 [Bryobacteraceae bacterium]
MLLAQKKVPETLAESQEAEALAPDSASVNATLGRALDASGRPQEALPYYQKALMLATAVEPRFQQSLAKGLEQRPGAKRPWIPGGPALILKGVMVGATGLEPVTSCV